VTFNTVGAEGALDSAVITTLEDEPEIHPADDTVKVYDPPESPETKVLVPVPVVVTPPGVRVSVQVPTGGNPFKITLPVATVHVGCVILPIKGADKLGITVRVYIAVTGVHGPAEILLDVTFMIIVLPASATSGVYVNANGLTVDDNGLTVPAPFSVIVTLVALPPKLLPLTVTGRLAHVFPDIELKVTVGGFIHPHVT